MADCLIRWTLAAQIVAAGLLAVPETLAAAGLDDQAAAWAAADARVLARAAPRLADSAVAPTFLAMETRVGAYADWVYGWFSSLLTAWDLGYVGASTAGRELAAGRFPDAGFMHDRLATVVQERFEGTVILPERTGRDIAAGWERAMQRLSALDARLAAERRIRIERIAAGSGIDASPALRRHGGPLLAPTILDGTPPPDLAGEALGGVEPGAGGTADRVLVRSLRPLATRAISVTTRLLLAPAAGGTLASAVLSGNGIGPALAAMLAVSAGVWGVDYAINEVDRALTRPAFEAELRRLVRDARDEASRLAKRRALEAVCTALGDAAAPAPCRTQLDVPQRSVATAGGSG